MIAAFLYMVRRKTFQMIEKIWKREREKKTRKQLSSQPLFRLSFILILKQFQLKAVGADKNTSKQKEKSQISDLKSINHLHILQIQFHKMFKENKSPTPP